MIWIYDNLILYAVFAVYFQAIWLWMPPLLVAVLLTPLHRSSAKGLTLGLLLWHVVCLCAWDMHRYAPVAAWVLGGALILRLAVWVWYVAPHGWFSTALIRASLWFDPGCSYLFDLARARRGLPVLRSPRQRRDNLPAMVALKTPCGRVFLAFAAMCDLAIGLYPRLPAYWRLGQGTVDLAQPHVRAVLESQLARVQNEVRQAYQDTSLGTWLKRTPRENVEQERLVRLHTEQLAHLYEALGEYEYFLRPMPKKARRDLLGAHNQFLEAWRTRCRYEHLWTEDGLAALDASEPATRADEPAPAPSPAPAGPMSDEDRALAEELLQSELEGRAGQPAGDTILADEGAAEVRESPAVSASVLVTEEDQASEKPGGIEGDAAAEEPAAAVATVVRSKDRHDEAGVAAQDGEPGASIGSDDPTGGKETGDTDELLFRTAAELAGERRASALGKDGELPTEMLADHCLAARHRDVCDACACMEVTLHLDPPAHLAQAVAQARPFLQDERTWAPVFHLLVMYCARSDWTGEEADRLHMAVIKRLWTDVSDRVQRFRPDSPLDERRAILKARRALASLLLSRRDYALIRSLYRSSQLTLVGELEILAEACAMLSEQVGGNQELRSILRYEAMDHYFRAGYRGVWRPDVSEHLIGRVGSPRRQLEIVRESAPPVAEIAQPPAAPRKKPPQASAVSPAPANQKRVEGGKVRKDPAAKQGPELLQAIAARLAGTSITLKAKANELGNLYEPVTAERIAKALATEGYKIAPKQIAMAGPIRTLNKYRVLIRLAQGIEAEIGVWVVPE